MTTVHLVYPYGDRISAPHAIGRNLAQRLRARYNYNVLHYDFHVGGVIKPGPDDVLLGHPHPIPWSIFRRSARLHGWKRVIAMFPYSHGDAVQTAFADALMRRCDLFLAITGRYWFETMPQSLYSHWVPKAVHLDLAVDRGAFPVVKDALAPPGKRKFLYIGHGGWQKNPGYLAKIAELMPEAEFSWIGEAAAPIRGLKPLGKQDFRTDAAKRLVAEHDFTITVSRSDANPTTILESMAWGLIPVCTPQSGYSGYEGIPNVPLGDPAAAVGVLRRLQQVPAEELERLRRVNWKMLDAHFNWDRFASQVAGAIESTASPPCGHEPLGRKIRLRWAALQSPYSIYRPAKAVRFAGRVLRRLRGPRSDGGSKL